MYKKNKVESFSAKRVATVSKDAEVEEIPEELEELEEEIKEDAEDDALDVPSEELEEAPEEVDLPEELEELEDEIEEMDDSDSIGTVSDDEFLDSMATCKKIIDLASTFIQAGKRESANKLTEVLSSSIGDVLNPQKAKATMASMEKEVKEITEIPAQVTKKSI